MEERERRDRIVDDDRDEVMRRILATEQELRDLLDRIQGCVQHVKRVRDDERARYHGLLFTLQGSLDTVKTLERSAAWEILDDPL